MLSGPVTTLESRYHINLPCMSELAFAREEVQMQIAKESVIQVIVFAGIPHTVCDHLVMPNIRLGDELKAALQQFFVLFKDRRNNKIDREILFDFLFVSRSKKFSLYNLLRYAACIISRGSTRRNALLTIPSRECLVESLVADLQCFLGFQIKEFEDLFLRKWN